MLIVVLLVFLRAQIGSSGSSSNSDPSAPALEQNVTKSVVSYEVQQVAVKMGPTLPPVGFPSGSVGEACGLNKFPPMLYRNEDGSLPSNYPFDDKGDWKPLESTECWSALEEYMNALNPIHWSTGSLAGVFVVLEHPLTFERIFADPEGDLARVQAALSRPECLLQDSESNWELKELCHAEAFLNYALFNRLCYMNGIDRRDRTNYWENDRTPEQDRHMWKQELEDHWAEAKCRELDPELELKHQPELYELIKSFGNAEERNFGQSRAQELLIELAARLGDDAAGLTMPISKWPEFSYEEEGYKFGRFTDLLSSDSWARFASKQVPSAERFDEVLKLLAVLNARRPDPRDEIEFDWEVAARHLCEPPYFKRISVEWASWSEPIGEHLSCREVIHELRQQDIKFTPLLQVLDKFEQVALELDVYE